jgi:hypothetical protein
VLAHLRFGENRSQEDEVPEFRVDYVAVDPYLAEARSHGYGLVGDDPDLIGIAVHFHWKAHRGVQRPDAPLFQRRHNPPRDLVRLVAGMMELHVRHGAGGAADGLPVHPHHETDQRPRVGKHAQDVLPLVRDLGSPDLDEADIVR